MKEQITPGGCFTARFGRQMGRRIRRFAPIDFIGRYMDGFFDYAIADEVHELKGGDTAQGNALGTLAASARHIAVLTGTLLGGYTDNFLISYFASGHRECSKRALNTAKREFGLTEIYGLLEKITVIEPADNACSEARVTTRVRHRPGSLTPAVWPLPNEPGCLRFAGRYLRCSPALPGGNCQRGDGPAFAEGL